MSKLTADQAGTHDAANVDASNNAVTRSGRGDLRSFDLTAFIRAKREMRGTVQLRDLARMLTEVPADAPVDALDEVLTWSARGEIRREVRREAANNGRPSANVALTTTSHTVSQPYLLLDIRGRSWVECQRCMKAFEFPVDIDVVYKVMDSEEEADEIALDEGEVEVIVGSDSFDFIDLLDEEVILSLPMVPKHDVCPTVHASVVSGVDGSLGVESVDDIDARVAAAEEAAPLPGEQPLASGEVADEPAAPAKRADGRPNPFAALAGLRQSLADDEGKDKN